MESDTKFRGERSSKLAQPTTHNSSFLPTSLVSVGFLDVSNRKRIVVGEPFSR